MNYKSSRRDLLKNVMSFGGLLGLRSLAAGLPASILLTGIPSDAALAAAEALAPPQFLLMALNHTGDPISNNCPGTYDTGLPGIYNNPQASMAPQSLNLGAKTYQAAKPWRDLQNAQGYALDRTTFIHHTTRTNIHAQYAGVMKLMGSSRGANGETNSPEFVSSMLSAALAPIHGTIQKQPLYMGGPSVDYEGQALAQIRPDALKRLFPALTANDKAIRDLRDTDLKNLNNALKSGGSRKQKAWLDDHVRSQDELRKLNETLVQRFSSINGATAESAIDAALIAFKLKISPVATFYINFGSDNHTDPGLGGEAEGTVSGCATLEYMFKRLVAEGLQDQVTFASLGVFGRTLGKQDGNGRDHNLNHHVTVITGKHVRAGVIGGLQAVGNDFGAMPINSVSGAGSSGGDISLDQSLESVAKTLGAAVGLPESALQKRIKRTLNGTETNVGKIISAALKTV